MDSELEEMYSLFLSMPVKVTKEWLEGCISYFREENPGYSHAELKSFVHHQWTLSDLRESTHGCLPEGLGSCSKMTISGKYTLQVESFINVGESAYSQLQSLRKEDMSNVTATERPTESWLPKGRRILKLVLCDGHQKISAVEFKAIPSFQENMLPGVKVTITGPVVCRKGVLLLKPENVVVLGGEVDTLLVPNHMENMLARALNLAENPAPLCLPIRNGAENELIASNTSSVSRQCVRDVTPLTDIPSGALLEEAYIPLDMLEDLNAADWTDADLTEPLPQPEVQKVAKPANSRTAVQDHTIENIVVRDRPPPPPKKVKMDAGVMERKESHRGESLFNLEQYTSPEYNMVKSREQGMERDFAVSPGEALRLDDNFVEYPRKSYSGVITESRNTVHQSPKPPVKKKSILKAKLTTEAAAATTVKQQKINTKSFLNRWMSKKETNLSSSSSMEDVTLICKKEEAQQRDRNSSGGKGLGSDKSSQRSRGDSEGSSKNTRKTVIQADEVLLGYGCRRAGEESSMEWVDPADCPSPRQWRVASTGARTGNRGSGNYKPETEMTPYMVKDSSVVCETFSSCKSNSSGTFIIPPNREKSADDDDDGEAFDHYSEKSSSLHSAYGVKGNGILTVDPREELEELDMETFKNGSSSRNPCEPKSPPVLYICTLAECSPQSKATYRVKATILRLLSRLNVNEQKKWCLSAEITDGSGSLKVYLHHEVLNDIIGFSGADLIEMKKSFANNPAQKAKAHEALQRCQQKFVDLCCFFDVTFVEEYDLPLVCDLHEMTSLDVQDVDLE